MKIKCVFALFTAILFFLLLSCTKEGNEENISKNYSITYNGHYSSATIDVFEYDKNGEPIHHIGGKFYQGRTREFTAQSSATKVKVHVELPFDIGWVKTSYSLSSSPLKIVIDDNTSLGAEP